MMDLPLVAMLGLFGLGIACVCFGAYLVLNSYRNKAHRRSKTKPKVTKPIVSEKDQESAKNLVDIAMKLEKKKH
jgi:hypothetical protein